MKNSGCAPACDKFHKSELREDGQWGFYVHSHSCAKRLSGVMSARLSGCNNKTLPGRISVKSDIESSTKTCRETPYLVKIGGGEAVEHRRPKNVAFLPVTLHRHKSDTVPGCKNSRGGINIKRTRHGVTLYILCVSV